MDDKKYYLNDVNLIEDYYDSEEYLKPVIFDCIQNQLNNNDPPETKRTFNRLLSVGYTQDDTLALIGKVILSEIFDVFKSGEHYNEKRFTKVLKDLK